MDNYFSPDWAMVVLTAVYVIATIIITVENCKTVKVSKEQLDAMKREFEDNNRPRLEVELDLKQRFMYNLRIVNNGNITAKHVKILFAEAFLDSIKDIECSAQVFYQKEKECIIGVGQHYDFFLFPCAEYRKNKETILAVEGTICYRSNGNKYNENFCIDLRDYMTFFSCESEEEKLRKAICEQNNAIKRLNETVALISEELREKKV